MVQEPIPSAYGHALLVVVGRRVNVCLPLVPGGLLAAYFRVSLVFGLRLFSTHLLYECLTLLSFCFFHLLYVGSTHFVGTKM